MGILIDDSTRVIVQGITGRIGSIQTRWMLAYGTKVVGGVTPGKGGSAVEGLPVFDSVEDAVKETGANASVFFVPAAFVYDGDLHPVLLHIPGHTLGPFLNGVDASVDVDKDSPEIRLHHDQFHALIEQLFRDAPSCFKEVGRFHFFSDDVHRGHAQPGPGGDNPDVSVKIYVSDPDLPSFPLNGILDPFHPIRKGMLDSGKSRIVHF